MSRQLLERIKIVLLVIALLVLGAMVVQLVVSTRSSNIESDTGETPEATATSYTLPLTGTVIREEIESTVVALTTLEPEPVRLADEWANRLLARLIIPGEQSSTDLNNANWWLESEEKGVLSASGDSVLIGSAPLSIDSGQVINILVPSVSDINSLKAQAMIAWEGESLLLAANADDLASSSTQWRISQGSPVLAIEALIYTAESDERAIAAAYRDLPGNQAQLVVVLVSNDDLPLSTTPTPSGTATVSLTPVQTPTATSQPDPYLGNVIAGIVDPVISSAPFFHPTAQARFSELTPMTGELSWRETGVTVDEFDIPLDNLSELSVYTLQADDPEGKVVRLLDASIEGNELRLTDQQLVFYDHSLPEIYYWLVQRAGERGGRLVVSIEVYGTTQAVTIIDFIPGNES